MNELKCPNCGAPINRKTMRCDYCGAVFMNTYNSVVYQVENPKIVPLKAIMKVDEELTTMDGYEGYMVDHLAYSLAKQVAKYMDVTIQHDPRDCTVTALARVRVVPPNVDIW